MIVVSDTSPLNYLILISHADVLPILFDRVVAPPAVITEMLHPGSPPLVRAWATSPPPWLEIIAPERTDPGLKLGAGEREAIAVASEMNADILLMDERKGTSIAHRMGLVVIGTLNVLGLASERKLLDLEAAIAALRGTTFREPKKLVEELLRRDAQRRNTPDH